MYIVNIETIRNYIKAVGDEVVSKSDLELGHDECKEDYIRVVLAMEGGGLVWLLYENEGFSIEMEMLLSGGTVFPWLVSERTTVEEGARQVLEYYELYCKKVKVVADSFKRC